MRATFLTDVRLCMALVAVISLDGCSPGTGGGATNATADVEAREIAFAQTMADRDLNAFRTFLSPEAVFFSKSGPLRGRDAIAQAWGRYFEGPVAPFSWHPDLVEVLDSGQLALTSGPVLAPSGDTIGRFNSIWRKDADGTWRVVFDKGS